MPIFIAEKDSLSRITEQPFIIERDLQRLVEKNINTIFGISFVSSEFELNDLRVDTVGFDNESNSFVIIEYKRDKNFSVIDQGYAYLALMLNNKADFILQYNEQTDKPLKKDQVDWSQSKVIFISPEFTPYQRKAIEFRDLPIELWEVTRYLHNIILFNQIKSPDKSESITKISRSEVIDRVSREVQAYTEDYHLNHTTDAIRSLYTELREKILLLGTNISIKPKAKYIAFIRRTNFVDVVVRKSNLTLFLNIHKTTLNDPKKLARDVSSVGHWGNGDYEVIIKDSTNLEYVLTLIMQSYDKN